MSKPLPVLVSFGGVNSAGRSSSHHAHARVTHQTLSQDRRLATFDSLRQLSNRPTATDDELLAGTLIRQIGGDHFDPYAVPWNQPLSVQAAGAEASIEIPSKQVPETIPAGWSVSAGSLEQTSQINLKGQHDWLLPTTRDFDVKVASQLPDGFDPISLYPSRNHPRGVAMSVYAASDTLGNLGLTWDAISSLVSPDQISVYAGSSMGQLDDKGFGGMLKQRHRGGRVTSKQCPLGMAQMPGDFTNAYVLGTAGATGATIGACATFLYNLRHAVHDIREGRARIAIVGAAEAPINPETMDGYLAMGALATDKELRALDGLDPSQAPNYRRACRPFAENCGFTMGESAQFVVLFDDALALETGASVFASVPDVFVNADGPKKSISGPGIGNYLTVARATACAQALLGDELLRTAGFVHAHGTGTPQNRVTESAILNKVAAAFGINDWPVAAVKCYLGHSLAVASGDQLAMALGTWDSGWLPGIEASDTLAADVLSENLSFCLDHRELAPEQMAYALINAKGFGGNNATATVLGPTQTVKLLRQRHGLQAMLNWEQKEAITAQERRDWERSVVAGEAAVRYRFDDGVLGDEHVLISADELQLGERSISLRYDNPYA
ncbi:MAG: beta-ketoacyl synthase [Pseudomonadota bacterium]